MSMKKCLISFTDEMKQHNITIDSTTQDGKNHSVNPGSYGSGNTENRFLLPAYTGEECSGPLDEKYYMKSLYKFLKDTYQIVIEKGKDTLEAALPSEEAQAFLEIGQRCRYLSG